MFSRHSIFCFCLSCSARAAGAGTIFPHGHCGTDCCRVGVCACLPCPASVPVFIERTVSASRNAVWKSGVLQEYVTWVNWSLTARTLLGIGAVQIMGLGQLFCYTVTLACLWINQGLPQTAWKRKVRADLIFLQFVLSLAQHSAEVKAQERAAVISLVAKEQLLPWSQLLCWLWPSTEPALPSRRGLLTLYCGILLLLIVGMVAVKHRVHSRWMGKLH